MTITLLDRLGFSPRLCAIAVVLGGLFIACRDRSTDGSDTLAALPGTADTSKQAASSQDTLPPPLVPPCPTNRPPQNKTELDACVSNLQFDTLPEAGDEQRLLVMDAKQGAPCQDNPDRTCSYGPLAKIEPVKNAHNYTPGQIREGRIIARLFITRGQEGYPKLSLFLGHKTYWWVRRNATGTGGQSVYISDSISAGRPLAQPRKLEANDVPRGTFKQALARWFWVPDDETAKGTCGQASCK